MLSLSVWPTELEKETAILICCCLLDFKLYSLLLLCSGRVQSKYGVDLVEVSIFCKSEKTSGQTIWPNSSTFVPYHGCLVFYFSCSFYCTLDYLLKIKLLH